MAADRSIIPRKSNTIRLIDHVTGFPRQTAGRAGLYATVLTLDAIAEERIREAQARGEFDGLPGSGKPLALDDDAMVPEELRAPYRLLKNAGFVPPELEVHCRIREVEQLLQAATGEIERARLLSRLNFLLTRSAAGRRRGNLRVQDDYLDKLAERLDGRRKA
jgi:hypothetical protein